MRHCIARATVMDVACMASGTNGDEGSMVNVSELFDAYAESAQVWAARDSAGQTSVLWGVRPMPDDQLGYLWLVASEKMDAHADELAALTKLVVSQMLATFSKLENYVDPTRERGLALLKEVGFQIDPAKLDVTSGTHRCRVWIDASSTSLSGAGLSRFAPN